MTQTALLVIDVQNAVVAEGAQREAEVLAAIADLAARARSAGAPVIYVQHNEPFPAMTKGAEGWQVHPAVAPLPGELKIDKTQADSFTGTPSLSAALERLGVGRVVMCGLQTDQCVNATVRSGFAKGYDVVLAADAHTTSSPQSVIDAHNTDLAALGVAVKPAAEIGF
ncbi:MAG TPA: isochorismatase family protein [Caulobacteraceae bacterium]|nr:isochorismatase family protein [Caulobacteraceae bacterium]